MSWYQIKDQGIVLHVKVQPQAKMNQVSGVLQDIQRLKLKIAAPALQGKANEELLKFLSDLFGLKKNQCVLTQGKTSKFKEIFCKGLSVQRLLFFIQGGQLSFLDQSHNLHDTDLKKG